VEEARQHPALSVGQRLFAWVYNLGSALLAVALLLQMFWRVDALYPTILLVATTRICLGLWQLSEPDCSTTARTRGGLMFSIMVWAGSIVLLVWVRLHGIR
jgi:hypothetical protein